MSEETYCLPGLTNISVMMTIETPSVPNFIRFRLGADQVIAVPVEHLTHEQLVEVANAWKVALLANAKKRMNKTS